MNHSWLAKYPKAAALLQGDDDVLLYEPQSAHGPDDGPPLPDPVALGSSLADAWLATLAARRQEDEAIDREDW